jgi:hypothetical protein
MPLSRFDRKFGSILLVIASLFALAPITAQTPSHYEPTIESLGRHPLPQWYADAKPTYHSRSSLSFTLPGVRL